MENLDNGGKCKGERCGGDLKGFEYRPESGVRPKDPKLCKINGLPIDSHICVAECTVVANICTRCRLVQGGDTSEHHPERSDWTKRNGTYTRKGNEK